MRAGRLMALLLRLQQGDATAASLAALLEVSVRTIYRDVSALQAAGVPLWTEGGHGGGIRLLDGWRTRLDGLTGPEAEALFLSAVPSAAAELGLGAVMAAAQTKVLATRPPELRGRAARVRERFLLDAPGWFQRPEPVPSLGILAEAVWRGRRLELRYRRGEGEVTRRLDPLGLVLKAGVWYLVARPSDASDATRSAGPEPARMLTYRMSRVLGAEELAESVQRPEDFDLAAWWAQSAAEFDRSILRARVRLRLSPAALRLLPHLAGVADTTRAVEAAGPPDAEGWRELELAVESEAVALTQLSGLGAGVEVLEPPALRAALADVGAAMAARNRTGPRSPLPSG